jgi:hypothetical protein
MKRTILFFVSNHTSSHPTNREVGSAFMSQLLEPTKNTLISGVCLEDVLVVADAHQRYNALDFIHDLQIFLWGKNGQKPEEEEICITNRLLSFSGALTSCNRPARKAAHDAIGKTVVHHLAGLESHRLVVLVSQSAILGAFVECLSGVYRISEVFNNPEYCGKVFRLDLDIDLAQAKATLSDTILYGDFLSQPQNFSLRSLAAA